MVLTKQEIHDLREKLSNFDEKQLNDEFDKMMSAQQNFTVTLNAVVNGKTKQSFIKNFIDLPKLSGSYNMSGPVVALRDSVENAETLSLNEIKTLQKLIVEFKWTGLLEATIVANVLKSIEKDNIELAKMEEITRTIAEFIQRSEQEKITGLQHKEGDATIGLKETATDSETDHLPVKETVKNKKRTPGVAKPKK